MNDEMKARTQAPAPAPATRGLDALDRERAASLTDEGGAAGAVVEGEEPEQPRCASGKKDEIAPAFDDSGETPALPARLRLAPRDRGSAK
jgi:hypothetical protein